MSPPLGICSLERDSSPATHGETRIQGDVVNPRDNIGDKAAVVRSSQAEARGGGDLEAGESTPILNTRMQMPTQPAGIVQHCLIEKRDEKYDCAEQCTQKAIALALPVFGTLPTARKATHHAE